MSDIVSLAKRLDALEARVTHQDQTIEDLNLTVTQQWKEIETLTRLLAQCREQVLDLMRASRDRPEPPPPHY